MAMEQWERKLLNLISEMKAFGNVTSIKDGKRKVS